MAKIIRKENRQMFDRMTEVGRLYKGSPSGTSSKGAYRGGDDYASHYLRFEPADRFKQQPSTNGHENLHAELKAKWEDLIAQGSIVVQFPSDRVREVFDWDNLVIKELKKNSGAKKTFFRCDGNTCSKWTEYPDNGPPQFKSGARACFAGPNDAECPMGCKPKGMLRLFVPQLHPGLIVFPINSPIDVTAIDDYLHGFVNRGISLSGGIFRLFRKADDVSFEQNGETKSKTNWGVHLEIEPTLAQLFLQSRSDSYLRHLSGQTDRPLALAGARVEDYRQSDDHFALQNRITAAARSGDAAAVQAIATEEKRRLPQSQYDPSAYQIVDREVQRGIEMVQSVQPIGWADRIKSAREELGLTRDQVISIAQDNNLTLGDNLTVEEVDRLIRLMAASAIEIEYEVTIEGE